MSKPYQHHDLIADAGKAVPHPKAPNSDSPKHLLVRLWRDFGKATQHFRDRKASRYLARHPNRRAQPATK